MEPVFYSQTKNQQNWEEIKTITLNRFNETILRILRNLSKTRNLFRTNRSIKSSTKQIDALKDTKPVWLSILKNAKVILHVVSPNS